MAVVQVAPHGGGTQLLGEQQKKSQRSFGGKKPRVQVPGTLRALMLLPTAKWLQVRNAEVHGIKDQITQEVTNLGLILALLCTIFMPLYYTEVSRITSPEDTFYMDVTRSHIFPLAVNFNFVHDYFDIAYCVAACASFLGTLFAAFMQLAVNECGSDEGVAVFVQTIGPWVSAPYYCLNLCGIAWGATIYMHMSITARTAPGLGLKLGIMSGMVVGAAMVVSSYVKGVYAAKWEEDCHPPRVMDKGELQSAADSFFESKNETSRTLQDFLDSLRPADEGNYRVPLEAVTQARATHVYYLKLSEVSGVPIDLLYETR